MNIEFFANEPLLSFCSMVEQLTSEWSNDFKPPHLFAHCPAGSARKPKVPLVQIEIGEWVVQDRRQLGRLDVRPIPRDKLRCVLWVHDENWPRLERWWDWLYAQLKRLGFVDTTPAADKQTHPQSDNDAVVAGEKPWKGEVSVMGGKWIFQKGISIDRIKAEIVHVLNDLDRKVYSFEWREVSGVTSYTVSYQDTEIAEIEVYPTDAGQWSYSEKALNLEPRFRPAVHYVTKQLERHLDKTFVIVPQWIEEIRAERQSAKTEPQTDGASPQIVITEPLVFTGTVERLEERLGSYHRSKLRSPESVHHTVGRSGDLCIRYHGGDGRLITFEAIEPEEGKLTIVRISYPHRWKDYFEELIEAIFRRRAPPPAASDEHAEPQADGGAVAEQPTPVEDEGGKERGPTARTQIRTEVFKRLEDEHPEMSHTPNWFLLRECGEKLTREDKSPFTRKQLIDCVHEKRPERKKSALHPMIQGMTVNARGGAPGGIGKNMFYRVSRGQYVLYEPKKHGQITKGETIKPSVAHKNGEREKMDWDVFISHAWEDKESFARPLAKALEARGLRVWFDEFTLRVGDRLRRSIDHGLANSRYGVVILSPHFLEKEWPQKELDGLVARETTGEKVVLPVWHNISADQIREYSPTLADRVAVSSDRGLEHIVSELLKVLQPTKPFEPDMVLIPAGEFLMGSDPRKDKDAYDDEQPQHTQYLPDHYLAKTPVTNAQYEAFVQATGHIQPAHWEGGEPPRGKEDHPIVYVSWHHAIAYCRWLSEVTGKPYRLPSEAEWEKGARGSDGRIYPWGNRWAGKRCNSQEGHIGDTTPVRAYPEGVSPYGLLDMVGNVWEWTRSLWGEGFEEPSFKYPYDPADGREYLGAPDNTYRVLRGGSYNFHESFVRCASRHFDFPHYHSWFYGFRVVLMVPG